MPARLGTLGESLIGDGHDCFGRFWYEVLPSPYVFLRPEEVHPPSSIGPGSVGGPILMGYGFFRLTRHHIAISHLNGDRLITVGANRVYPDQLTRKQPAHGQRLRSSLTEPFLLVVHADSVLVGLVGERADGDDVVILVEPTGISSGHQAIEDFTRFS